MRARQSIGSSSYGPEELKVLFEAFDAAWEILAPTVSASAEARTAPPAAPGGVFLCGAIDRSPQTPDFCAGK